MTNYKGAIMHCSIINEQKIFDILKTVTKPTTEKVTEILNKAKCSKGLTLEEVAALLQIEEDQSYHLLFETAKGVKDYIYGKRVVLFAPLYTSNECTNNCLYCGFRAANKALHRRTLDIEEIQLEAKYLESQGHKRLLLVCGEDAKRTNIDHIASAMTAVYESTDIRRLNVNAAPMSVKDFKKLKEAGVGTYQCFQETYHRETYEKMHPTGSKSDYDYRLSVMDRALEAGIDDLAIGVLFGLYDWKFEVLALLQHAEYMDKHLGVGPHTISVPRLRPALGSGLNETPYPLTDLEFKKVVAILRLAVPYTGIILSTRENSKLRDELLDIGVSQVSAGSKTSPGGYKEEEELSDQFAVTDHRSLDEILYTICEKGYIPSFCTACYRKSRTGEHFMDLAKEGTINKFCQANSILTFKENLLDYASERTIALGNKVIENAINQIPDESLRNQTREKISQLELGARDLYF